MEERIRALWHPMPSSWTLTTALHLLSPFAPSSTVYLMTGDYLQNWLDWAYHQPVPEDEQTRLHQAIRLAAVDFGLTPPHPDMLPDDEYDDPGPLDATALAVEGHPLLLSPLVEVVHATGQAKRGDAESPPAPPALAMQRSRSATTEDATASSVLSKKKIECLAVPEAFYESLRAVHGVLCDDGESVTFQKSPEDTERLLLHHQMHHRASLDPRPIEFRRKVVAAGDDAPGDNHMALIDRLLLEEQERRKPTTVVEAHPIKLVYLLTSTANGASIHHAAAGFVLVSRSCAAVDALLAVMRAAVPHKSSQSVRLWSRHVYNDRPTLVGDEYELVNVESLKEKNRLTGRLPVVGEWVQALHPQDKEVHLLIETLKTVNSSWPRAALTLEERIQVGDFVDAQDVAGKWYEAVVRRVDEDAVTVHYMGWASRWDAHIRRRPGTKILEGIANRVKAPAPLWSRTDRWRERIAVGDIVEVRDSSSLAERPKWYKGEIKKVGRPNDPVREIKGGAPLEVYPVEGDESKKEHLLLLRRLQQVLVEVEQEKPIIAGKAATSPGEGDLAAGLNPEPPFLRWVNLYGEEICQLGTHLKADDGRSGPVTLRYETDHGRKPVEVLKSHPNLGTGFMRESLRGSPPAPGSVGLHNMGNSCFMNSTVQCLNHIEPLTQYFLQDRHLADLNAQNPLGSGGNVTLAYASLLKKMWSGDYAVLAPRALKQTVAAFAPQFDNSYQHDSQEFCQFLMDGLHEDLNRVKTKPYVEELEGFGMDDQEAAIESWRKHLLRHDSIIVDHCQGMHRSHLTCPRCGRESIKFDVFSSISLPLATTKKTNSIKLEDCLEKFMEGEQLDERNAWYCPSCRQHVCALKMIALWSVPDILILHLKRFTFDTCMTSGGMLRSKMDYTVDFPIEKLDLTKHILGPIDENAPPVYRLFGVSEHTGPTANSGHYTATVRNSIDSQWYRCNDSHVGRTSGEASITGGAYLLFYQRAKGISKWAGMAKVMESLNVDPYGGLETDQHGFKAVKTKKKKK